MKIFLSLIFSCFTLVNLQAQQTYADSLKNAFLSAKEDSTRSFALDRLSYYYSYLYPDSALYYADTLIHISDIQNYPPGKAMGYVCKGEALDRVASQPEALEAALKALEITRTIPSQRSFVMGRACSLIGHLYYLTGNNKEAIGYFHIALGSLQAPHEYSEDLCLTSFSMAFAMLTNNDMDSALYYAGKGESILANPAYQRYRPWLYLIKGTIMQSVENYDSAAYYFRKGIKLCEKFNSPFIEVIFYNSLAQMLYGKKEIDSCVYYSQRSLVLCQKYKYKFYEIDASRLLASVYDKVNVDSAYKYINIMVAANNEVNNTNRGRQFQKVAADAGEKEKEFKDAKDRFRNSLKIYGLITLLSFFAFIAIIFWRNNRHRKKANTLLTQQKEKLEHTLAELNSTQAQLIQSEKMASLGELTAGIAHEIQNPLNFVNNFSDVNNELVDELKSELTAGNLQSANEIADNIKVNGQKINLHGKRADSIVKGMLQHSRSGTVHKELTDINALADEYLRLSYHGFRAKDKSFNATIKTEFDNSIGKIYIVPQDIGRVFLNLLNNAFYAVSAKASHLNKISSDDVETAGGRYEPTVKVSTNKTQDKVEIKVTDSGNGIPQNIIDKIFQPFFTTKPAGQGTGLGLSLAYDIITKEHNGSIKVESKEGEKTTFIIQLPF